MAHIEKGIVEKFIIKIFFVIMISFVWTIVLPGFIAYYDQVFYSADVEQQVFNLNEKENKNIAKYKEYKLKTGNYQRIIGLLDKKIEDGLANNIDSQSLENLSRIRDLYKKELIELKKNISTAGFYNSGASYCYLFSYIFLTIAVFLLPPSIKFKQMHGFAQVILLTILIIVIWRFSGWLRVIEIFNVEQTMFSYVEYRFSRLGFWSQEIRGFGLCFLISLLWHKWFIFFSEQKFKDKRWKANLSIKNLLSYSDSISEMFNKWQYNFLIITFAFLPWTYLYWKLIFLSNDSRYVFSAFSMHLFWFVTWAVISLPLIYTFYFWTLYKNNFLVDLVQKNEENISNSINFVREINPLSNFQIIGAVLVTIISFLSPFINLLLKTG